MDYSANSCPLSIDNTLAATTELACWNTGPYTQLIINIAGIDASVYKVVGDPGGLTLLQPTIIANGKYVFDVEEFNRVCLVMVTPGTGTATVNAYIADLPLGDLVNKIYRFGHTYAISGEIKVPVGDTDFVVPFFVSLVTGQSGKLVKARHKINGGTSATCKLQINDVDATGFTGISVTTTSTDTDPADITLADNDKLALVVTAVSAAPTNLSFTIFLEFTQ